MALLNNVTGNRFIVWSVQVAGVGLVNLLAGCCFLRGLLASLLNG